jgi:hypothetical protein
MNVLKRAWMPLLIVVVVAIAGFTVYRRAYSEQMATNFADPMTWSWHNWAKIFFNNKGVAAKETDNCVYYPPDDASVWGGSAL